MGRGSSNAGGSWTGGGGGMNPSDVADEKDMISSRNPNNMAEVDDCLTVSKHFTDMYGDGGMLEGSFQISTLKGVSKATVLGYYDGNGIGMNDVFLKSGTMNKVYDKAVADKYHPSRGNKSGIEAVAAHEYGHALTDMVGRKMGSNNIDDSANRIIKEAKVSPNMAGKISKYAQSSPAEAIAEACSDVYCNGKNANKASIAIMKVVDKYLK